MATEQFCLKWNNFQSNIITNLENLKCNGDLVDVTLTCEGKSVKAHKVILSACSTYFRSIFKENPCSHPIVILKGVSFRDISSLISFMYQGEVHVQEDQLSSFLRTAEHLQIRGLADVVLPDEMLISEQTSWKDQKNKNGSASPVCPSSAPETMSSSQSSPFPHPQHDAEAPSPRSSPVSALASKPLQSMHVPDFPLTHQPEGMGPQGSSSAECSAKEGGNMEEGEVWKGEKEEAWRVNPKMEPMESENIAMQEPCEEGNSERTMSFDWRNMPPSGSDSLEQRLQGIQQRSHLLTSQISITSAHQDQLSCFPCPLCDKVISSKSNLQKHMKIRHSSVITQEVCVHCGKVFKNKYSLKYHSTYHCVMNRSNKP